MFLIAVYIILGTVVRVNCHNILESVPEHKLEESLETNRLSVIRDNWHRKEMSWPCGQRSWVISQL